MSATNNAGMCDSYGALNILDVKQTPWNMRVSTILLSRNGFTCDIEQSTIRTWQIIDA